MNERILRGRDGIFRYKRRLCRSLLQVRCKSYRGDYPQRCRLQYTIEQVLARVEQLQRMNTSQQKGGAADA
ncbi:MAG TPA: hypothetical protein VKR06_37110 [Ktedonosporobacter sp.]|nr:hypothetical protein [Ktedonosporobacter sp.]